MNIFLFLVYLAIGTFTIILVTILILYVKNKAVHKQSIRDQILTDLAFITGTFVSSMAFLAVIRELTGPFNLVIIVASIFYVFQYLYSLMLSCIVSLEIFQVLNIYYSASFSEWKEETLFLIHRTFVIVLGCSTGCLVCYFNGGICRPSPFYYYILQETQEPDSLEFGIHTIMLAVFAAIIVMCQAAIEIKRFLLRRDENRVDQLAVEALRQMEEATSRLRSQPPMELGVHFLPLMVKIAWTSQEDNHGRSSTNLNVGRTASILPCSVASRYLNIQNKSRGHFIQITLLTKKKNH